MTQAISVRGRAYERDPCVLCAACSTEAVGPQLSCDVSVVATSFPPPPLYPLALTCAHSSRLLSITSSPFQYFGFCQLSVQNIPLKMFSLSFFFYISHSGSDLL